MDDRRPAQAGAQNPAYRPTHPPSTSLTCAGTTYENATGHNGGTMADAWAPGRFASTAVVSAARSVSSGGQVAWKGCHCVPFSVRRAARSCVVSCDVRQSLGFLAGLG